MDWLEPINFACFYEKLGTLILCLFLGTHMYITLSYFYVWNSVPFLLKTLEPFSALLGTLCLCLNLWTAWNKCSWPTFIESSEPCFFACFYGLLGILILCLFLWTAQNPACLPAFMNSVPTLLRTLEPFSALLGILRLCMFLLTDRNPASLPAFMKSLKPWFFACLLELTCIGCMTQILSCFYTWNSFPTLLGTLEPWNPFLLCLEPCIFAKFYRLFGTQLLFLLLWKVWNTDTLPVSQHSHVLAG